MKRFISRSKQILNNCYRYRFESKLTSAPSRLGLSLLVVQLAIVLSFSDLLADQGQGLEDNKNTVEAAAFLESDGLRFLDSHCLQCHNESERESGIRVDYLDGSVPDQRIKLWEEIAEQIESGEMPPKEQPQPSLVDRSKMLGWIESILNAARSRQQPIHGGVRRLTVEQYRNTLQSLLGLEEDFTAILPPDGISKHGFTNDTATLLTSPLQVEAWFEIAEKAIEAALVDETVPPKIQYFRMDLGRRINSQPFGESLILGANSHLLPNQDFLVVEPNLEKPFNFEPMRMRTHYRFNEGYRGNSTVRGWREYNSIYHSVFACMRGDRGYPKGDAYRMVSDGLLLRPAIPTTEIFRESSTYGPKANFKVALRELPEFGRFRITVSAAKYNDGLLLTGRGIKPISLEQVPIKELDADSSAPDSSESRKLGKASHAGLGSKQTKTVFGAQSQVPASDQEQPFGLQKDGIYRIDIESKSNDLQINEQPDSSRLNEALIGHWTFDADKPTASQSGNFLGALQGGSSWTKSPLTSHSPKRNSAPVLANQALDLDGKDDSLVTSRDDSMNVGEGDFTVSAWIRPTRLQQGGIICLGKYSWTHGWYFDMPNDQGVLRIETVSPQNQSNGTVASRAGVIRANQWQHVAAVVQRGENRTHLYVNGYRVATGTINAANLDNPSVDLHIGRIQDSKLFKGQIDEVRIYKRALKESELAALLLPGASFLSAPPFRGPERVDLSIDDRSFASNFLQGESAFLAVRLRAGEHTAKINNSQSLDSIKRIVFSRIANDSDLADDFEVFEKRVPSLGVYMGLRRDCGHTAQRVQKPVKITSDQLAEYRFEGAVNNYPRPFVQPDNDNYLAGVREITVRNEYTDGRDMPRLLIHSVEFEGPFYEQWPPKSHQRILIPSEHADQPEVYAKEVLSAFATRAFRRPVTDQELLDFVGSWSDFYNVSGDFRKSLKQSLVVVLTSPSFLFTIERSQTPEAEPLAGTELASKLSYFLWNGPPDESLMQTMTGDFRQASVRDQPNSKPLSDLAEPWRASLRQESNRLIQDPQFAKFCDQFVYQWLSLDKFDVVETDRKKFPRLNLNTKRQLSQEPARFFEHLMRENLPVHYLIRSPIAVMNETVANYYGLGDQVEAGFEFVPIEHGSEHMGGLLTQAAILAGLTDGREANPVKRGAWFARKLIAEPPDDPPPNVPDLKDDLDLSLRERLEQHRSVKGCAKCHQGIDPWGLPFESFHAGGLFSAQPVDASTALPDGTLIRDFEGFRTYLVENRMPSVAFSLLKHLSIYAVGRSLTYTEEQSLREKINQRDLSEYRMRDLLHEVIQSDLFLTK